MATLQQTIVDKFIIKLIESKTLSSDQTDGLRTLLVDNKKPKPEDLIRIFSITSGDVK